MILHKLLEIAKNEIKELVQYFILPLKLLKDLNIKTKLIFGHSVYFYLHLLMDISHSLSNKKIQ